MSPLPEKPAGPRDPQLRYLFGGLGLLVAVAGGVWLSAKLGDTFAGTDSDIGTNPLAWLLRLVTGQATWPGTAATVSAAVLAVLATGLAVLATRLFRRVRGRSGTTIDAQSRHLATPADARDLGRKATAKKAARLRPGGIDNRPGQAGIYLGDLVGTVQDVHASFEDTMVLIAGPRKGKSTIWVIPMAVEAPGPVVLTSNKRDVHDATRDVRARTGHVWAFDPNDKLGLRQDFWFDLPGEITSIDVAREVASHFAMGDRAADARTDAYFDKEGETLLARLLLATARGQATLSDTFRWVQNPYDRTPVDLLTRSGDLLSAEALEAQAELPDKQREGVYGTARSFLSCLENPDILRWVTPPKHTLPRFIASDFVASTDTLHSLSEEGEGSAGPLVAALTTAVFNAGRRRASRSPSGRLDPPCLSILDEAANVVRLRRLPALYSHFGSQGLPTVTVLQSWSQGVGVWGEAGMKALWGAATVRIYGGGGADPAWLHDLSQMVGTYDRPKTSLSTGRGGTNVNHDATDRPIYPVSDLASLPAGRAVAFISQHRPMLLRTRPWMTGPYANDIRDSLARWDPQPSL